MRLSNTRFWFDSGAAAILAIAIYLLGYQVVRSEFSTLIILFVSAFGAYAWLLLRARSAWAQPTWQFGLGIALRIGLLWCIPALSDDCYRFLWDGYLSASGMHPFAQTPCALIESGQPLPIGLTQTLFERLNSPDYYTVYPPLNQLCFELAAWAGGDSIPQGIWMLKMLLLAAEIGLLFTLWRTHSPRAAAWWSLNPLVLIEVMGNCHFEGMMVLFMLLGIHALVKYQPAQAGVLWALAIATKLLPLLLIPVAVAWLGIRKGIWFVLALGASLAVLMAPLADWEVLRHMSQSVGLYFEHFEFNASVYYLTRFTMNRVLHFETAYYVSKILVLVTIASVLAISWLLYKRQSDQPQWLYTALWSCLMLYLFNATTVHPWYVLVPLGISLYTPLRSISLLWSGLVVLSYSHYTGDGTLDVLPLVCLSYVVLFFFIALKWRLRAGDFSLGNGG
jgi:alpha-1,6-mannosyltransferase